ncbi:MAG: hypothetical protein JWP11_490 [Frankiales bacterium]|nr:hypothetical protein [Frankiales bacterium]
MTTLQPGTIIATVDQLDGTRVDHAVLAIRHITRLNCGCIRYSCHRPGGGLVDVTVGEHCERQQPAPLARPSPAASPESIPA